MRMMFVGAHPADVVDLAGGTIAHHRDWGDEIVVVTVTDGVYSHSRTTSTFEDRRGEVVKALDCLSFRPQHLAVFMGLRDEPLMMNQENVLHLVDLIRRHRPYILVSHHPHEYAHWDHSEVGKMVCRALKGAMKLPGDDRWWVNDVYFFATQFRPESTKIGAVPQPPDVLIEIEDVLGRKLKAMCCFKLQGLDDERVMMERFNSFEREMGRVDGLNYAEGFIGYYPLRERNLPVSSIRTGFYTKEGGKKDG